ncbi:MAG: 30S ribosomal protein S20 [Candidatus Nealsonbacteria bacterium CG08_land_8_20_14_0_20_43_11]|uniref:Small ribosomal subunit protein bS20 n=1 Tax=Candidatus Nealsonbacteria bacterium CG08_land_8_20_14_0_20_43_11 TaxID=1974706 RepID=A0A2M6T0X3_9BACT|nr:MAG: 30S ribosomal protein S20 [Candidatus Nealsonbacteria bacterium CG08_land_8_20_14_0_20_43_11]
MPITKSAKKALRQNLKRRAKNQAQKEKIKTLLKEVRALVSQNKTEEAEKKLSLVYKFLDKAAKTGLIKKNTASRRKSTLARLVRRPKGTPNKTQETKGITS